MDEIGWQAQENGSAVQYDRRTMVSPEIVEIGDDGKSVTSSSNGGDDATTNDGDVYVAVGKDDLHVLKWALGHCVPPGSRVFLVHIFPPIAHINTPVGRLSRNQLDHDQARVYINQENNKRRNLLQKYIRLCADANLNAEMLLFDHKSVTKAILELIPVLNITKLVIGVKRSPYPRRLITKKPAKGELVRKKAPDYCEVTVVYDEQKSAAFQNRPKPSKSSALSDKVHREHAERKFFDLGCFSACRPDARETQQSLIPWKNMENGTGDRK